MKIPNVFSAHFNRKLVSLFLCFAFAITNATSNLAPKTKSYNDYPSLIRETKDNKNTVKTERNKALTPQTSNPQKAELVVQTGHSGWVASVAFSPDGKILVSGSYDGIIKLYDVESKKELRTLSGHSSIVNSITFSPDRKTFASGSADETIKLWDIESGKELRTLKGHSLSVTSIALSPNGKTVASGSWDKTIKLWDVENGKELRTLSGHSDDVYSVAFNPNGKTLASGSTDETIKLWDVESGKELKTLTGHSSHVLSITFSPNGKTLTSGSYDKTIKVWDAETGKELRTLSGYSNILSVTFSPDGKTLASGGLDNTIKLWDVESGKELKPFIGHSNSVWVTFSPDGKTLASNANGTIKLWDIESGKELRTLSGHSLSVTSFTFSPDRKTFASGSLDKTIKLWDVESGKELRTLIGHSNSVWSVTFSSDGKTLVSESTDETIKLWDVESGKELRTLTGHSDYYADSVAFSPDGKTIVRGSLDKTIKLWDIESGKELKTLSGHSSIVNSVTFSPDGKTLASGSYDNTTKLWDVESGKELKTLSGHSNSAWSAAFSSDGKVLASGSADDNTIKLWDVVSGKELESLDANINNTKVKIAKHFPRLYEEYYHAAVSDKFIAEIAESAKIKLFEKETHKELATLIALDENDWAVVDQDGRFDASEGAQKMMHFVVGLELIDLKQIKDRYYQPKLLEKILKGEPLRAVTPFTGDELYPLVKYEPPKQGQKNFTIGLKNRGGGIGAVQVFINGKEFIGDARPKGFDSKQKEATITVDLSNAPFIAGKENVVKVYARNSAGWLRSRGSESLYVGEGKETQETPHLYAIIGGVSDYAEDKLDLRYSSKDAEDFARAVEMGASKLLGKDRVHLRLLTSGAEKRSAILQSADSKQLAPTKENFKAAFTEFRKAKPTDIFVIYLSGHGTSINKGGDTGDTYLYLMQDATTTDSTRLLDEKLRDTTTISSDELVAWIKEVPALKQVMVLDTCAAGAAETSLFAKRDLPTDQIRAIDRLKDRTGFFVLMGSAANAQSYEATRYGQGLLTYALLQGMQGAKLRDAEFADISLLFNYAEDSVPEMAKGIGGIQQPRIIAPTESRSFDIGRFTTEEKSRFTLARVKPLILRPVLQNDRLKFDNLRLTPLLTKALRDASYSTTRGGRDESPLVFVDADEMYDAITPSGVYEINGDTLKLTIILVKNNNAVKTLSVTGNINDKDALIRDLVKTVTDAAQGLQTLERP